VNAKADAVAVKDIEASNAIKTFVAEGEIDFIVAPRLTETGPTSRHIGQHTAVVETPAKILAKKVFCRASDFTAPGRQASFREVIDSFGDKHIMTIARPIICDPHCAWRCLVLFDRASLSPYSAVSSLVLRM
jgi:hypothetical protein